jgi:hypothetical protein
MILETADIAALNIQHTPSRAIKRLLASRLGNVRVYR